MGGAEAMKEKQGGGRVVKGKVRRRPTRWRRIALQHEGHAQELMKKRRPSPGVPRKTWERGRERTQKRKEKKSNID